MSDSGARGPGFETKLCGASRDTTLRDLYQKVQQKQSRVMTKPVYAICKQQKRRSACALAKSDQRLCCSLPRQYITCTSTFYIRTFKPQHSFCGCAGRFESYLDENPEDRFSRDEAQKLFPMMYNMKVSLKKS